MWNQFCGRAGKGTKMARDQREEHLNRFLKDGFKTLGVNLNPTNAKRINNSADLGQSLVAKVSDFHRLDFIPFIHFFDLFLNNFSDNSARLYNMIYFNLIIITKIKITF